MVQVGNYCNTAGCGKMARSPVAVAFVICTYLFFLCASVIQADGSAAPSKADNVSAILNGLLEGYDKRIRPNFGGTSVPVNISMYVYNFGPVSEAQMQYTLDLYFRQQWTDDRLRFTSDVTELSLNSEMVDRLWVPDTLSTRNRPSSTLSCTKTRSSESTSKETYSTAPDAYSDNHVRYHWIPSGPIYVDEAVTLPQFKFLGSGHRTNTAQYYVSNYSQLISDFYLGREISYYLINVYLPATLIVIVSWVSFWIPRSSTPARTALGITTVLTMTTLIGNAGSSLPKLSYIKAIDFYLEMCYFFVFAALLEFALVSYYEKPSYKEARQRLKEREANGYSPASKGSGSPSSVYSLDKKRDEIEITFVNENALKEANLSRAEMINRGGARRCSYIRAAERGSPPTKPNSRSPVASTPRRNQHEMTKCEEMCGPKCADFGEVGLDPGKVDMNSRRFFPLVFCVLKIAYWAYYIVVTSGGLEDLIAEVEQKS